MYPSVCSSVAFNAHTHVPFLRVFTTLWKPSAFLAVSCVPRSSRHAVDWCSIDRAVSQYVVRAPVEGRLPACRVRACSGAGAPSEARHTGSRTTGSEGEGVRDLCWSVGRRHTSSLREFIRPFSFLHKWWLVRQRMIAVLFSSGRLCARACVYTKRLKALLVAVLH